MEEFEFGAYIRTLREKADISLNQLAEESGVSNAQISRIENGKRGVPKVDTLKRLAKPLKVSYEELLDKAGYFKKNNKNSNPGDSESEFMQKLELSDDELLDSFSLVLDGKELTPEEAQIAIAFLRTTRQMRNQK